MCRSGTYTAARDSAQVACVALFVEVWAAGRDADADLIPHRMCAHDAVVRYPADAQDARTDRCEGGDRKVDEGMQKVSILSIACVRDDNT